MNEGKPKVWTASSSRMDADTHLSRSLAPSLRTNKNPERERKTIIWFSFAFASIGIPGTKKNMYFLSVCLFLIFSFTVFIMPIFFLNSSLLGPHLSRSHCFRFLPSNYGIVQKKNFAFSLKISQSKNLFRHFLTL